MIRSIMRSFLLILLCALVMNSEATTLTESHDKFEAFNRIPQKPPPPPSRAPPSGVVIPLLESLNHRVTPPPPPKSDTPVIEIITTEPALRDYGRKGKLPPPAPMDAPPSHQVSGGGLAASEQSSHNLLLSSY